MARRRENGRNKWSDRSNFLASGHLFAYHTSQPTDEATAKGEKKKTKLCASWIGSGAFVLMKMFSILLSVEREFSFVVLHSVCRYIISALFSLLHVCQRVSARVRDDLSDERAKFSQKFKCFKVTIFLVFHRYLIVSVCLCVYQLATAAAAVWCE